MSQQSEKINQENEKNIIKTVISVGFVILCSLIIIYTACFKLNNIIFGLKFVGTKLFEISQMPNFINPVNFFIFLVINTAKTLWIPILIYALINLIVKDTRLKILSYITTICLIYLLLVDYVHLTPVQFDFTFFQAFFKDLLALLAQKDVLSAVAKLFDLFDWNSLKNLFKLDQRSLILVVDLYFFISLVIPTRFAKIFICVAVSWIVSLLLALMPDFPLVGGVIDWSINRSVDFFFFLLYFVAALTQIFTVFLEKRINSLIQQEQPSYSNPK
jgi:hypothetical protein